MFYRDAIFSDYIYSLIIQNILDSFEECSTAFELGAGRGRFSYTLVEKFPNTYLIEPSKSYASILKNLFRGKNVKIFNITAKEFFRKDLISGNSVCFSFHLLHHLGTKERKEIFDYIKNTGSKAVFIEPNPWNPLIMLHVILHPAMQVKAEMEYVKLSKHRLVQESESCGLKILHHAKLCFFPPVITNALLHSFLKNALPYFEKYNNLSPFFGSYQLLYCSGT